VTNLKIFCLTIYNNNYHFFRNLGYVPVGLGNNIYNKGWLLDNNKKNISKKNIYYGEYTFHYWLWKNYLNNLSNNEWIGFCTYRRFWTLENCENKNFKLIKKNIITKKIKQWENAEVILPKKLLIGKTKTMKIIKNLGIKDTILDFKILFKKEHNLFEHFKIFHGERYMNEAIKLLNNKDRIGFEEYLLQTSFNPHNLFICKNVKILEEFYKNIFKWLFKCEERFDMRLLNGYQVRMLGFLAEHFVSYWFQKNFSVYENEITFFDTNKKLK